MSELDKEDAAPISVDSAAQPSPRMPNEGGRRYSREELLTLASSPLVQAPSGLKSLREWYGFVEERPRAIGLMMQRI